MLLALYLIWFLPSFAKAIIGGEEVYDPHKYPGIVRIYKCRSKIGNLTEHKWSICGGSIISENVILTAAHCVTNTSKIWIQMGHSNMSSEEAIEKKVKSALIHPDYNPSSKLKLNDIALLKLNEDLIFDTKIIDRRWTPRRPNALLQSC